MILKNKFLTIFLSMAILILLFACGQQNKPNKNAEQTDDIPRNDQESDNVETSSREITIDTFSAFPPEIDGCSCYFSNDSIEFKKRHYIYMNNYAETSFLKINGNLTKFTQTNFKQIHSLNTIARYKSDNYEMTIESKNGIQNGDETSLETGTIKLTDKNGKTIRKTFYGECGC